MTVRNGNFSSAQEPAFRTLRAGAGSFFSSRHFGKASVLHREAGAAHR
jgi:hypothetical protein